MPTIAGAEGLVGTPKGVVQLELRVGGEDLVVTLEVEEHRRGHGPRGGQAVIRRVQPGWSAPVCRTPYFPRTAAPSSPPSLAASGTPKRLPIDSPR